MKKKLFLMALVMTPIVALLLSATAKENFTWHNDLATATIKAKKEGKPLLIVFR